MEVTADPMGVPPTAWSSAPGPAVGFWWPPSGQTGAMFETVLRLQVPGLRRLVFAVALLVGWLYLNPLRDLRGLPAWELLVLVAICAVPVAVTMTGRRRVGERAVAGD